MPLSTFSLFSDLPTELQLKIWSHAPLPPRIIELEYIPQLEKCPSKWHTPSPSLRAVPPLLHTSSSSRAIALQVYDHTSFNFWINWDIDTIYLRSPTTRPAVPNTYVSPPVNPADPETAFLTLVSSTDYLKPLANLAFWTGSWFKYQRRKQREMILSTLPGLKVLTLVGMDEGMDSKTGIWMEESEVSFEEKRDNLGAGHGRVLRRAGRDGRPQGGLFQGGVGHVDAGEKLEVLKGMIGRRKRAGSSLLPGAWHPIFS